jgi:hypothetical protein
MVVKFGWFGREERDWFCLSTGVSGEVWPASARLVEALLVFCSTGVAAVEAVGRGGVVLDGPSTACFFALSTISCCFFLSLAKIGTKSGGTTVLSLKFSANFFRSFSLTALSRRASER